MAEAVLRSYLNPKINALEELPNEYASLLKCSKKKIRSKVMETKNVRPVMTVHLVRGEIFVVI
jgi:hypothetical protein